MTAPLLQPYIEALDNHPDIVRWRLLETQTHVNTAGFSKKGVADIYQPARQQRSAFLSYAIEFNDLMISYGQLNPTQTTPAALIKLAQATSIKSKEELGLVTATSNVRLPRLIQEKGFEPQLLSKLLPQATQLRDKILATDPKSFEGELHGRHTKSSYVNSNGVVLDTETALYSAEYEYNGRVESSFVTRDYDELFPGISSSMDRFLPQLPPLEDPVVSPEESRLPVFIMEGTELIDLFFFDHMHGSRVESGSSRFVLDDFTNKLQVTHPSLTLSFDQTIDNHIDSVAFSSEGVLGQKFTLIDKGRLVEPVCDIKSAQRLGFQPRLSVSADAAILPSIPTFEETSKKAGTFILIFQMLGVFTQNTMLGTYSLPCPEALYFKDGKLVGPVKPVITGNFFDVMKADTTQIVSTDLSQSPMLTFETDVTFS